eukprot:7926241-Pyramimonas_sp.AAC.1
MSRFIFAPAMLAGAPRPGAKPSGMRSLKPTAKRRPFADGERACQVVKIAALLLSMPTLRVGKSPSP